MSNMALFVDYENLSFVLQKRESCRLNHQNTGEELRRYALRFGPLAQSVMWAEWDRYLPNNRQEQSAQAILTALGFDCLYLLRPSDRSYTEQAILKKLAHGGEGFDKIILVSGDYSFPEIISSIEMDVTLVTLYPEENPVLPDRVQQLSFYDVVDRDKAVSPLQTPHGLEPAAFYIWMQRILHEELRRRNWQGMSFHMLTRLLLEKGLCEEEIETQFYINQAVHDGFLERMDTELPTGRRVLLKPTIVERSGDQLWLSNSEFRDVQLIWALDLILARNPWWEYVTFSRLREELEKWSSFQGANELQEAVEGAVQNSIYKLCVEEGGPPLFRKKYKYTFGEKAEDARKFKEIPALILKTIRKLLTSNPHWHGVSFSKLLDELADVTESEVPTNLSSLWFDRQRIKDWCNFLVSIDFLHAFRGRSRMTEGEYREPPTLLRVVPEHPWIVCLDGDTEEAPSPQSSPKPQEDTTAQEPTFSLRPIDFYRLIVVVEHYLHISNNDAVVAGWMPMSTLFHVMGRSLDRAFCNAIVRAAREKEILEIRTHDPRPGQHPARGAHLDLDHVLVGEARERLLHCLEVLQEIQDQDGAASLIALERRLAEDTFLGENEEERLGWIELMREENLILVRPVSTGESEEDEQTVYQCSLNFRDRYVLALLESISPMTKPYTPPSLASTPPAHLFSSPGYEDEKEMSRSYKNQGFPKDLSKDVT